MTIETAAQFFNKAVDDDKLLNEIKSAIDGGGEPLAIAGRVAAVGKKHGVAFTPEEALLVRTAIRQDAIEKRMLDEELSEEELEVVAGGLNPVGAGMTAYSFANGLKQDGTGASSVAFHSIKAGVSLAFPIPGVGGVVGSVAGGLLTGNVNQIGKDIKRTANTVANLFNGKTKW